MKHRHHGTTPALAAEHRLVHGQNPDHRFDVKHAPKHEFRPHHDELNKDIHDPHGKHVVFGRPGVTVGHGAHEHDEFHLADDSPKSRYLIATNSDGHHAIEHGSVSNAEIAAHQGRFAVNPAHTRGLVLPGKEAEGRQPCVLSWFGTDGAAWIRVADLHGGHAIEHAANSLSHKDNPHVKAAAHRNVTRFVIRNGGIASATDQDRNRYMNPHQKSTHANHKSDYLEEPDGKVNLCQSLPGGHAAAIAIDVLMPGQFFFVPNESHDQLPSQYVREVAVYKHGAGTTKEREVWVFGFVGKGAGEPDPSRCGWLPLRVIAPAP